METYYKVVISRNKKLFSAMNRQWEFVYNGDKLKKDEIRYYVNKWVYPKKNAKQALFVFNSFEKAKSWARTIPNCRIYECKIDKIILTSEDIHDLADYKESLKSMNHIVGFCPNNCVLVYSVKLIKKVRG